MMIDALNRKGYNGFAISVPSPNEFLQIFMLAAPAFVAILSKVYVALHFSAFYLLCFIYDRSWTCLICFWLQIVFYALLVFFATSMGTKTVAAHQVVLLRYMIFKSIHLLIILILNRPHWSRPLTISIIIRWWYNCIASALFGVSLFLKQLSHLCLSSYMEPIEV